MFILLGIATVFCVLGGIAVALFVIQSGNFVIPGMLLFFALASAAVLCGLLAFGRWQAGRRYSLGREIVPLVIVSGLFTLSAWFVFSASTARFRADGHSMRPSLPEGQYFVIDLWAYRFQTPERGDLVLYEFPAGSQRTFIKRVIGLPNEQVEVRGGWVYINGQPLNEPYLEVKPIYTGMWLLGPQDYFVLGDNRHQSADSHNYGSLNFSQLDGRVSWLTVPEWGAVRPPAYSNAYP